MFIILNWGYGPFGDYGFDIVAVFGDKVEVQEYLLGL
jgi:hypothetical protein